MNLPNKKSYTNLSSGAYSEGSHPTNSTPENPCGLIAAGVFCVMALFFSGCCDSRPIDSSEYQSKVKVVSIQRQRSHRFLFGDDVTLFTYKTKNGEIFDDGWAQNSDPKVGDLICVQTGCMGDCHNLIACPEKLASIKFK